MTISEETLRLRLQELREEFDNGSRQLALLERRRDEVRETLLRIKGAIQVLEELSTNAADPAGEEKSAIAQAASG